MDVRNVSEAIGRKDTRKQSELHHAFACDRAVGYRGGGASLTPRRRQCEAPACRCPMTMLASARTLFGKRVAWAMVHTTTGTCGHSHHLECDSQEV